MAGWNCQTPTGLRYGLISVCIRLIRFYVRLFCLLKLCVLAELLVTGGRRSNFRFEVLLALVNFPFHSFTPGFETSALKSCLSLRHLSYNLAQTFYNLRYAFDGPDVELIPEVHDPETYCYFCSCCCCCRSPCNRRGRSGRIRRSSSNSRWVTSSRKRRRPLTLPPV